jgi:O-antigen ligase
MKNYLNILFKALKDSLNNEFKWFVILFVLWEYRVSFMSDTGVGVAKILQVVTVFGLIYLIYRYRYDGFCWNVGRTNAPILTCTMLYVIALASTLWAYMPSFAFFLALQNLMLIFLFLWFLNLFDTFEGVESAFLIFSSLLLIFIGVTIRIVETPSLFVHHLSGASAAALLFCYTVGELLSINKYTYANRKMLLIGGCVLSLFILITHTSSGANASAIFGFAVALLFSGNIIWALILMIIAGYLFFNQDRLEESILMIMPGKNKQTLENVMGRKRLWDLIIKIASQKPLMGWGFASAERVITDKGFNAVDSHNNFIGIYGGLGYVGCIFMGVHLVSQLFYSVSRRMHPGYLGILSATCCAIVNGYTYGFLSGKASSITVMYISLVCLSFAYSIVNYDDQGIEQ